MSTLSCPCGLQNTYEECCGKIHKSIFNAKTAEQLMRSRYTAFVKAKGNYLMQSHHSSTRPIKDKKALVNWAKSVSWIKLEVLETFMGKEKDSEGTVTFKAIFYENGKINSIDEKSAFIKEHNHWVYLGLAE